MGRREMQRLKQADKKLSIVGNPSNEMRMADLVYPPAGKVAPILHERLSRQQEESRREGRGSPAPLPAADIIERLIETGFWASLRREEGRSPKISLAVLHADGAGEALVFDRRIPLAPRALTRLAPAVERPGIHLCVSGGVDDLHVWGATRGLPEHCLVLEVVEPGLVVAKYSRDVAYGKFGNLAMFKGHRVKIVDEDAARRPDCPEVLANLTGIDGSNPLLKHANILVRLALSMRAHGHGGTLLVVPNNDGWQRSIVQPVAYRVAPPFSQLAELVHRTSGDGEAMSWTDDLRQAIDGVAGLTAVDGATLISMEYELLAFGAKIERAPGASPAREVLVMEPVVGHIPIVEDAAELGGTRHLSAAQFAHDQRDALALVASQDGRFTIFAWSDFEDRLHAHRIETLLL